MLEERVRESLPTQAHPGQAVQAEHPARLNNDFPNEYMEDLEEKCLFEEPGIRYPACPETPQDQEETVPYTEEENASIGYLRGLKDAFVQAFANLQELQDQKISPNNYSISYQAMRKGYKRGAIIRIQRGKPGPGRKRRSNSQESLHDFVNVERDPVRPNQSSAAQQSEENH